MISLVEKNISFILPCYTLNMFNTLSDNQMQQKDKYTMFSFFVRTIMKPFNFGHFEPGLKLKIEKLKTGKCIIK